MSVRDIPREAGFQRDLHTTVASPETLGSDVVGVQTGEDLDLELTLGSVSDGILVTGTVRATIKTACVRCLDPLSFDLETELTELFYYPEIRARLIDDGDEDAEDAPQVDNAHIDLLPAVRDQVVLSLPYQPLCRPDCGGLCAQCGIKLDEAPADHGHEEKDPRWAALEGFFDESGENGADDGEGSEPRGE